MQEARVGTTHMKGRKGKQTGSRLSRVISHLGRTSARLNARGFVEKQHTTRDQPRASSPINDNYCSHRSPGGLLAGSQTSIQELFSDSHVNFHVVLPVPTAPGHSQKRELSPGSPVCHVPTDCKLKYVKGVSCVSQLSCVKPVTNVKTVASNLPVGARLQNFWQTWLDLGAGPKVVQILREGYTLPFRIWPNLTRSPTVISCYGNPHRNLSLLEALHQLIDKNAVELVWVFSTGFSWCPNPTSGDRS